MGDSKQHGQLNEQLRKFVVNFDEWSELASSDPDSFESRRQTMLDDFFEQIPAERQHRLRGLQFRIDMERRKAKTPLAACIRISNMMWDSVSGENGLVETIRLLNEDVETLRVRPSRSSANVLNFRKPN